MTRAESTGVVERANPEIEASIERLVPVLREYTAEEIEAMRLRLEALLERRQPTVELKHLEAE